MRPNRGILARVVARAAMLAGVVRGAGPALREVSVGSSEPVNPETRFETGDVHGKAALLTGAGLILVLWVIVLLTYPLFAYFAGARAESSRPPIQAAAHGTPQPPEPRIQDNPQRDLKDFKAYENDQLNGYHWVDRARGTVSIPIEDAMRIVAAHGIPPQPGPAGVYGDPQAGSRETGFTGKVEPR